MVYLDTNVVVRFLVNDDKVQAQAAKTLIDDHDVSVLWTVLLEVAWVLQSGYKVKPVDAAEALLAFLGLPKVHCENVQSMVVATDLVRNGMDLPDAIHLVQVAEDSQMASFDKKFLERGRRAGYDIYDPQVR